MAARTGDRSWFADDAQVIAKHGWICHPTRPGSKQPAILRWERFSVPPSPALLEKWFVRYGRYGIGISCVGLWVFDIDATETAVIDRFTAMRRDIVGETPLHCIGAKPGGKYVYQVRTPVLTTHHGQIDSLGKGAQIIAFGRHPEGPIYRWPELSPLDCGPSDLPIASPEQVEALIRECRKVQGLANISGRLSPGSRPKSIVIPSPTAAATSNDGRRLDNRDAFLRDLVWHHRARADDPQEIAEAAWQDFVAQADLTRLKRGGHRPWSYNDALAKAQYLVRTGKAPQIGISTLATNASNLADALKAFSHAVDAVAARRELSPAAVKVSAFMLPLSAGPMGCFASPATIARELDLAERSVKRARQSLVASDLWSMTLSTSSAGNHAHYRPNLTGAAAIAQGVTATGTRKSSEEGGDISFQGISLKENEIHDSVFTSLGVWREGGGA